MNVIVWITEGTWQAAVDAARTLAAPDAEFTLLHVTGGEAAEVAHGDAFRRRPRALPRAPGVARAGTGRRVVAATATSTASTAAAVRASGLRLGGRGRWAA